MFLSFVSEWAEVESAGEHLDWKKQDGPVVCLGVGANWGRHLGSRCGFLLSSGFDPASSYSGLSAVFKEASPRTWAITHHPSVCGTVAHVLLAQVSHKAKPRENEEESTGNGYWGAERIGVFVQKQTTWGNGVVTSPFLLSETHPPNKALQWTLR